MPSSTRFAVAVHTLAALAVNGGKPLRSEDLARSVNTGAVVIRGLLSRLSDAGLTKSQLRGRRRRIAGKAGEKNTPAGRL
jgi:DNA-binding IscR family transcriptional regulator